VELPGQRSRPHGGERGLHPLTARGGGIRRLGRQWRKRQLELEPERAARLSAALVCGGILGLTATLAAPVGPGEGAYGVGTPAPTDLHAPRATTFESEILTERERERQADAVPAVFLPTDASVAQEQAARARAALAAVSRIRRESPELESGIVAILAVPELAAIGRAAASRLMEVDDGAWETVRTSVPRVVQQALRVPVRPDTLSIARTSLMSYVDTSLDAETSGLIALLADGFMIPNTLVDEERTAAAQEEARSLVQPAPRTVVAGQMIVREGDLVTDEAAEIMAELGLLRERVTARDLLANLLLATSLVLVAAGTLLRLRPRFWLRPRQVALIVVVVLVVSFGARYAVPDRLVLSLAYPASAAAMVLAVILGFEAGAAAALVVAGVVGALGGTALEPAVYALVGGIAGAVAVGRVERLSAFLNAGLAVAAANLAVILAFRLPDGLPDMQAALELSGAALTNAALATGACAAGYLLAGSVLGMATSLQLLELARPDHPLLKRLQLAAPGTYQHSVLLGNLAETAAQAIDANALLVRVGAYYHDVGKSRRPYFFAENQPAGVDPHQDLDAFASARIVISHVEDGADLCLEYGLPEEVVAFVLEHHGTTRAEFFYHKSAELLGEEPADDSPFRYPGPKPQTRESALLMLADGSEAAVRAARPSSREEIDQVVRQIIRARLNAGELDDSGLTLNDLKIVRRSYVDTLASLYHPRIQYPGQLASAEPSTPPDTAQGAAAEGGSANGQAPAAGQAGPGAGPAGPGAGPAGAGAAPAEADEEHIAASVADTDAET
jgi:putative nucleotidyltransferase with HDIG domain